MDNRRTSTAYTRRDGLRVTVTPNGILVALVAWRNDEPVDSWDGLWTNRPERWIQ